MSELVHEQLKAAKLVGKNFDELNQYGEYYFNWRAEVGCDYSKKGDWQKRYAEYILAVLGRKGKLLDIGAAFGANSSALADIGFDVTITDISQYSLDRAFPNVKKFKCPANNLTGLNEKFDFVHCTEVLGHIQPDESYSIPRAWKKVLRKGGLVYITFEGVKNPHKGELEVYNFDDPIDPDYSEPGHINRRTHAFWEKVFTNAGYTRRIDLEAIAKAQPMAKQYSGWNIIIFEL